MKTNNSTPSEEKVVSWETAVRELISDPLAQELVEACYFDQPAEKAAQRYHKSLEWGAMKELIGSPRGLAVDIGAGNGIVSYALAKDGWSVTAIEPDSSSLVGANAIRNLAAKSGLQIKVLDGVGEGLPLRNESVRLVVARQVLHHAADLEKFVSEISRVLAPGGRAITTRDHVINGPEQLDAFFDVHPLHKRYGGENAFTKSEYRQAFSKANLTIEREFGSFDTVINYAPHDKESIIEQVSRRFGPLEHMAGALTRHPAAFHLLTKIMSRMDSRPGRLISFVVRKP